MEPESRNCGVAEIKSRNCSGVNGSVSERSELSECRCSYDCLRPPQNLNTAKTPQLSVLVLANEVDSTTRDRFTNEEKNSSVIQCESEVKMIAARGAVNIEKGDNQAETENDHHPPGSSGAQDRSVESIYFDDGHERNQQVEMKAKRRPTMVCLT